MATHAINGATASFPVTPPSTRNIVAQIALRCFKELAVSLTIGAVVSCFVAPAGIALLVEAIFIQTAVSLFFHTVGAFTKSAKLRSICEWMTGANFALLTGYNGQMLIHETGHALAFFSVYVQPSPQIELIPFGHARTQFNKGALSTFGKKIGPPAATCFTIASGPLLTLTVSATLFAIGLTLKDKYPALSKYLVTWALLDFICSAHYAYSAIGNKSFNLSHDFVHLSVFGISPTTATIGILAIPVLVATGVYFYKSCVK